MLEYEWNVFLIRRKWRWAVSFGIIVIYMVLIRANMHEQESTTQLLLLASNQHFFVMFGVPTLFITIIFDVLLQDRKSDYLPYSLTRYPSRWRWFTGKLAGLLFSTFLFAVILFGVGFLIGQFSGMPLGMDQRLNDLNISAVGSLIGVFFLLMVTLLSFGALVLVLSLVVTHVTGLWTLGACIALASYLIWFKGSQAFAVWMPTTQILYFLHVPNNRLIMIDGFTLQWSLGYTLVLFLIAAGFGFWKVRGGSLLKL